MKTVRIMPCLRKDWYFIFSDLATRLDIGLEKTDYTAHKNAAYQIVCANVKSGSVGGRKIDINYAVKDSGIVLKCFPSLHNTCIHTYSLFALC